MLLSLHRSVLRKKRLERFTNTLPESLRATSPMCKEYTSVEREGQDTTVDGKVFNV
jgi:hypothetical protein